MFKKKILYSLSFILPLIGVWIYQTMILRGSDLARYKEMTQQKAIASSQPTSPTNQHRKQVRKDIWFSQNDCTRLHYQIASCGSVLSLSPIKNKFEIVETLQGVKCWMQDKLLKDEMEESPTQQARLIEAKNGTYRHTTQEFIANGVQLSLFQLPGHSLPDGPIEREEAFLSGVAHNISFFFGGKTPQFQAEQFEATMVKE